MIVIVMNFKNGEILGMFSCLGFDFMDFKNVKFEVYNCNFLIWSVYEFGLMFKIIILVVVFEEKKVDLLKD